jgi:hypothetical protein
LLGGQTKIRLRHITRKQDWTGKTLAHFFLPHLENRLNPLANILLFRWTYQYGQFVTLEQKIAHQIAAYQASCAS